MHFGEVVVLRDSRTGADKLSSLVAKLSARIVDMCVCVRSDDAAIARFSTRPIQASRSRLRSTLTSTRRQFLHCVLPHASHIVGFTSRSADLSAAHSTAGLSRQKSGVQAGKHLCHIHVRSRLVDIGWSISVGRSTRLESIERLSTLTRWHLFGRRSN